MKIPLYLSTFAIIIAGCSMSIPPLTEEVSPPVEQTQVTPSTLTAPTPLPIIPVSPMPMQTTLVQNCPKIEEKTQSETIDGVAVITEIFDAQTSPSPNSYLLDIKSEKKIDLPDITFPATNNLAVSPNRKWLASFVASKDDNSAELLIIGREGEVREKIKSTKDVSGMDDWFSLAGWLDDKHVLVNKLANGYPFPLVLLNPFDKTLQNVLPEYPEIYDHGQYMDGWGALGVAMTSYSPDFNLVVYPKSPRQIVLWNILEQKEIVNLYNSSPYGNIPAWNVDGQLFALDMSLSKDDSYTGEQDEIFSVSRTGTINQLTHLNEYYKTPELDIQKYSWSPDSRYIAFWYSTTVTDSSHKRKYELAVLDTKSGQATNYCIVDQTRAYEGYLNPPVWSPNGKQLLVRGYIGNLGNLNDPRVILLDIHQNYATEIAKDAIPIGWMVSEP